MNKVYKIFYCGSNEIVFILQTEGDDDYWWWAVDKEDVVNRCGHWDINQSEAEEFANDERNELLGVSCSGDFKTVEDAVNDCTKFDMTE
jgi:hypothetical protein